MIFQIMKSNKTKIKKSKLKIRHLMMVNLIFLSLLNLQKELICKDLKTIIYLHTKNNRKIKMYISLPNKKS